MLFRKQQKKATSTSESLFNLIAQGNSIDNEHEPSVVVDNEPETKDPVGLATETKAFEGPAKVGLIGPAGAGKTTFFAALERALQMQGWSVTDQDADSDSPGDGSIQAEISRYLNQGVFPPKTLCQTAGQHLYFRIVKESHALDLRFLDPPGEVFEPHCSDVDENTRKEVFESIEDSDGLVVLMSLERTANDLRLISQYSLGSFKTHLKRSGQSHRLERGEKLAMPVAIVFTKADRMPWMARNRNRDAEAWLSGTPGLDDVYEVIKTECANVRFFFASAIGWKQGQPNCRTIVRSLDVFDSSPEPRDDCDLIPDPPQRPNEIVYPGEPSTMPIFRDPTRFENQQPESDLLSDLVGVITLPGRAAPIQEEARLTPWNIAEPLLWAAGFEGI